MTAVVVLDRLHRQREIAAWCVQAFGAGHAASVPQRAVRLLEEVLEACQAAGVDPDMAHRLVDFVYARPCGDITKELGGVGVTLLALAEACGVDADVEEVREIRRVMAKPLAEMTARNEAKNAAGFAVAGGAQ
ncbi:MAG TPA: hypothetical protein VF761_17165 [Gemmatimonadaceae bacterium]